MLLARQPRSAVLDINGKRISLLNVGLSTVAVASMRQFIVNERLSLRATTPAAGAYLDTNFVIVATTTDYDPEKNCFDTSSVEGGKKVTNA